SRQRDDFIAECADFGRRELGNAVDIAHLLAEADALLGRAEEHAGDRGASASKAGAHQLALGIGPVYGVAKITQVALDTLVSL
ncbi:MAG: hypothetical protein M3457_02685, partial [Chloroflexota bacterium]|nr:hypothetical protein [Chloroflexota bacterium]